jgi:hypothetical protein
MGVEKEIKVLEDNALYMCERVEIFGKHLYIYFRAYHIKDVDRLVDFENSADRMVSGTVPHLVAKLRVKDKLVEYYRLFIYGMYGEGEAYVKRITQDRPCRKHGILFISYHGEASYNYILYYREKDEFGDADKFDFMVYEDMMEEMGRYLEEEDDVEILYLHPEGIYDPIEYMALVENKEWAKEMLKKKSG